MMARKRLPQFDAPPVNEVAFGVKFKPVVGLQLAHIGLFWSRIKREFGKSDQQPPIAPIEATTDEASGLLLPRTWLIHNDGNYLIQLQRNLFFLNWRRIEPSDPYPHYKKIKPQFEKRLAQFLDFLEKEGLQRPEPNAYELTYVNIIPRGKGWERLEQVGDVVPDVNWRGSDSRFLPSPKGLGWQAVFDLPDNTGELLIQLQNAISRKDELPVIRLELTARCTAKPAPPAAIKEWFDTAHEWIVEGFTDLTAPEIQRLHWKRTDVSG